MASIISAAELTNSDAIHPGYGFLSESSEFCRICEEHNIRFIGPKPKTIDLMGNKSEARKFASSLSIPVIPGTKEPIKDIDEANSIASKIGFPVILKAVSGGGGKGMRVIYSPEEMLDNFDLAKNEALKTQNEKLKLLAQKTLEENQASKKLIIELLKENEKIKLEKQMMTNQILESENKDLLEQLKDLSFNTRRYLKAL